MGYWQTKVLPKIKKVFENKSTTKKAAAAEACKSFDESKGDITKEFEEKKAELETKVIEIYEATSAEIKTLVKERKDAGLKKYSTAVQKFLEELAKIEFPGSKTVSEASSKYGAAYVSGPVFFVFEKVSTFIVVEEKVEPPPPPPATEAKPEEREIVVEEDKKEEKKEEVEEVEIKKDEVEEAEKPTTSEPEAACEPPKVEEAPAAAEPAKP